MTVYMKTMITEGKKKSRVSILFSFPPRHSVLSDPRALHVNKTVLPQVTILPQNASTAFSLGISTHDKK